LHAAARELEEEMGVEVPLDQIIELGSFWPDAGIIDGKVDLFLALPKEIDSA